MTSQLPDLQTLTVGLAAVLGRKGCDGQRVTVLDRRPALGGTFPKEIVTCRLADGSEMQLFCKYSFGHGHSVHGHRGGVEYEAEVYSQLLPHLCQLTPASFGSYRHGSDRWLMLEYVADSLRLNKSPDPADMPRAAGWAGRFHSAAGLLADDPPPFLKVYDADYYLRWARRTLSFADDLTSPHPWLRAVCRRFEDVVEHLLAAPQTVIHGEFYPKNILVRGGVVYPVDWESTAVAPGEIDLASLSDGPWGEELVRECEFAYRQARWPTAIPPAFAETLAAARIYVHLRWLGDRLEWTTDGGGSWRFRELRRLAEQKGLI